MKDWKGPKAVSPPTASWSTAAGSDTCTVKNPIRTSRTPGWRFTAGDESSDYMMDPDKAGIYSLNTVCNYDPDIIPLLDAPYGTAYYRDETGHFHQTDMEDGEDDEPFQ